MLALAKNPARPLPAALLLLSSLLPSACSEGPLESLTQHRYHVAAKCGSAIAAALADYEPVLIRDAAGAAVSPVGLTIEPARYGLRRPAALAEHPRGAEDIVIRSSRCIGVRRSFRGILNIYEPVGEGYVGAELDQRELPSSRQQTPLQRVVMKPITTSLSDFRRCGPTSLPAKAQPKGLIIWPAGADDRQPPDLGGLRLMYRAPGQPPRPVQANGRGCWHYPSSSRHHRLAVLNGRDELVATRPLEVTAITAQGQGALPLVICPLSAAGEPQVAGRSGSCQQGFIAYCRLALAGELRLALGSWLRHLAEEQGLGSCEALLTEINGSRRLSVVASKAAPADLEALRYGITGPRSLTVVAERGVSYLPAMAGLKDFTVQHEFPDVEAHPFDERQPSLVSMAFVGGPVNLRRLPLGQLGRLAIKRASLASLADISAAQKLSYINLVHNQLSDIAPLIQLPQLASVVVGYNPLTDLRPLLAMPRLRTLDVSALPQLDLGIVRQLSGLTNLTVMNNGLRSLSWLTPFHQLTGFNGAGNELSDLSPLAQLDRLASLSLRGNRLRDLSPLSGLHRLQKLDLSQNQIADITPLRELPVVSLFSFYGNPLGTSQKKSTGNCPVDALSKPIREFCLR